MRALEFVVRGTPVPQGDLSASSIGKGKVRLYHSNAKELRPWRDAIAGAANDALNGAEPLEGPVQLDVLFTIARPATHFLPANSRRARRELRLDAPMWHAETPDVDKLARACLDALSGVAYVDDKQVAALSARSRWQSDTFPNAGAAIRVTSLPVTA